MLNTTPMSTKQKLDAIYVEKKEILSPSGNYRMVETPSGCFGFFGCFDVGEVKRWMMNNPNICLAIPEARNTYVEGWPASLAIVRTHSKLVLGGEFTARRWVVNTNGDTQKSCQHQWHKGKEFSVGDISVPVNYTLWERV